MRLDCYEARLENVAHANTNNDLRKNWHGEVGLFTENAKKTCSTEKLFPMLDTHVADSMSVTGNSQCPTYEPGPYDLAISGEL